MPKEINSPRRLNRPEDKIDSLRYKGYQLNLCWCGYPQTRWLVMNRRRWIGTCLHLKQAKELVNKEIKENNV